MYQDFGSFLKEKYIPQQEDERKKFAAFLKRTKPPLRTEQAPPETKGRMQAFQDEVSEGWGEKFMPGIRSVAGGFYSGVGHTAGILDEATQKITKILGKPEWKGGLFKNISNWARFQSGYQSQRGMKGVPGEVAQALGQVAVDLPQFMSLGAWGLPIHGALTGYIQNGNKGAAEGALTGALIHNSLGAIGQLPRKMQLPTFFGFGAATTPGGVKDRTVGALTWTALGFPGGQRGKSPQELYNNFLETYPFIKDKIYDRALETQLEKDFGLSKKLLRKSGGAKKFIETSEKILKESGQISSDGEGRLILQKVRESAGESINTEKPQAVDYLKDKRLQQIEQKIQSEGSASLTTKDIQYLKDKGIYEFSNYDKNREPVSLDAWDISPEAKQPTEKELRDIQKHVESSLSEENFKNYYSGFPITLTKKDIATLRTGMEALVYPLFVDPFYVTPQFSRIGGKETGLSLKVMPSRRNLDAKEYVIFLKELNKIGKERDYTIDDWIKITRLASRTAEIETLSPGDAKKYADVAGKTRKYLDNWKTREQEGGVFEQGFIESKKIELRSERTRLNEAKKQRDIKPSELKKIDTKLKEINNALKFIEVNKLEYVPIPRTWLESFFNKEPDRALSVISEQFRSRKTLNMEQLAHFFVEKGFIEKSDLDIRRILAQYTHQASLKVHFADVFQKARKEGLLANAASAPGDYVSLSLRQFPTLKGEKAHRVLERYLQINFGERVHRLPEALRNTVRNIMGTTKMLQFYNPLFLPMYDLYQAVWAGTFRGKTPKFIKQAVNSMIKKDQSWHDASYWGAFSTPFTPPFASFIKTIDRYTKKQPLWKTIGKYTNIMRLNWEAAWTLDNSVRMMTYHSYLDKGLPPKDAAQMTAKVHGDYANVPPQTRRVLNKIFFTPTFKLVMAEAQADMLKNLMISVNPKRLLDAESQPITQLQKEKAKAFVRLAGFMATRHWALHALGFKTDKFGVKYYKLIDTEEGTKELVVNVPTPDNVALRLLYRYWPNQQLLLEDNKIATFLDKAKWDLHPMWQFAHEMINNRGMDFTPIFNPDDSPARIWFDRTRYAIKRFLPIVKFIPTKKPEYQLQAYQSLRKDLKLLSPLFEAFTTPYVRSTKDKRLNWMAGQMKAAFNEMYRADPPKTPGELQMRMEKYNQRIQELQKQLDKYYKDWGFTE